MRAAWRVRTAIGRFARNEMCPMRAGAQRNYMEPNRRPDFASLPEAKKRPAVAIADDHLLMAEGLAKLVEDDFDVVAKVDSGGELLRITAQRLPDLALIDVSMPELTGVETTRKLLEIAPNCKVILISMHSQAEMVREAFRAGASGYILKRSAASELITAMWEVVKGNAYVSSSIAKDALSSLLATVPTLTPRQREVLRLVAEGHSAKEIAARLSIAVKSAQFHKTGIMTRSAYDGGVDQICPRSWHFVLSLVEKRLDT
jgi:DNA-binding NarL/FixJ family response regulator